MSAFRITARDVAAPALSAADLVAMYGRQGEHQEKAAWGVVVNDNGRLPGYATLHMLALSHMAGHIARLARAIRQAAGLPDDPEPRPAAVVPFPGGKKH